MLAMMEESRVAAVSWSSTPCLVGMVVGDGPLLLLLLLLLGIVGMLRSFCDDDDDDDEKDENVGTSVIGVVYCKEDGGKTYA